jgi:hypothetical protein
MYDVDIDGNRNGYDARRDFRKNLGISGTIVFFIRDRINRRNNNIIFYYRYMCGLIIMILSSKRQIKNKKKMVIAPRRMEKNINAYRHPYIIIMLI